MFKAVCFLFLVCLVGQTIQFRPFDDAMIMKELERELKVNKISLEQFLNGVVNDDDEIDNEISQLNPQASTSSPFHREPDFAFDAQEMIEYRGFRYEEHNVVTQDCYILQMHRIVNENDKTLNKIPVLLQHGLVDSSTGWMVNNIEGHINDDDDRNLGFALAKRGYDVWLGNYRGNIYSKQHTTYSTRDPQFWKFTYDNHALQDLPAQIAHVQKTTNYDQIAYIGYSQGTMTMFQLLSLKPDVAKAIKPYIALAPVAHVGEMTSPLRYLARSESLMRRLLYVNSEFLPNSFVNRFFSNIACRAFPGLICKNFLYLICGFSDRQLNSTRMPVYFNHLPAGTSLPNLIHFGQNYRSKQFTMLDYMSERTNLECYDSIRPPKIPLEKIKIEDLYLINAQNDLLADVKDVQRLKKALKVKSVSKTVELKQFGHIDFLLSKRSDYYVNDYIFKVLKEKTPSMSVADDKKVRLKEYNESTCELPSRSSRCHMNLATVLNSII